MEQQENKKQEQQQEQKLYTQEQLDNAIAAAKKRVIKDTIEVDKYKDLETKYNQLNQKVITYDLMEKLSKRNIKSKDVANDFIKLNSDLLNVDNQKLDELLDERVKKYNYMFEKDNKTFIDNLPNGKPVKTDADKAKEVLDYFINKK